MLRTAKQIETEICETEQDYTNANEYRQIARANSAMAKLNLLHQELDQIEDHNSGEWVFYV